MARAWVWELTWDLAWIIDTPPLCQQYVAPVVDTPLRRRIGVSNGVAAGGGAPGVVGESGDSSLASGARDGVVAVVARAGDARAGVADAKSPEGDPVSGGADGIIRRQTLVRCAGMRTAWCHTHCACSLPGAKSGLECGGLTCLCHQCWAHPSRARRAARAVMLCVVHLARRLPRRRT